MNKVVLILVDGMRPDAIPVCGHSFLQELEEVSLSTRAARTVFPSVTLPCHMSLFHSVDTSRHGVLTNVYTPQVRPVEGIFERMKAEQKIAASFYNWEELRDLSRPGCVDQSYYTSMREEGSDRRVTDTALDYILKNSPDFTFVYLGETDAAGHNHGWMGLEYKQAVAEASACIEKIVKTISAQYVVIVTADHGGHERMHGADIPEDMTIPLILCGKDFKPGTLEQADIRDIAPTIAKLTGISCAPEWEGTSLV